MAATALAFPTFFEGQYLGAEDLNALADYVRASLARHDLGQHTWGIVIGLELSSQPVSDTLVDVYVQPGVAVDGYGRVIVVAEPTPLAPALFVGNANVGGSAEVPVWIRYAETDLAGVRKGFEVCSGEDRYARAAEGFALEVGERDTVGDREDGVAIGARAVADARAALNELDPTAPLVCDGSIPHQALPAAGDALWLVPLGLVAWSAAVSGFAAPTDEQRVRSRTRRRYVGSVAERVLAADGLLRLGARTTPFDATVANDDTCAATRPVGSDFLICNGEVQAREPIWLEADTRVTGDLRLFDGLLELRDAAGRDYAPRVVDGVAIPPIVPLALKRTEPNARSGSDLEVLLGASTDGRNRLSIGAAAAPSADLCAPPLSANQDLPRVLIQDDGRLGIGTSHPDSALAVPLTIRGFSADVTENAGTPEEETFQVQPLVAFEDQTGATRWQLDLWRDESGLSLSETGVATGRLFAAAGGNVAVGTTEPDARLDVRASGAGAPWLSVGLGGDSGRVFVRYVGNAPRLTLSDDDDPPRLSFQQTGSTDRADDFSPAHESWIGQVAGGSADMAIIGGNLGIGTEEPNAPLTVLGSSGSVRLYSGPAGAHVWIGLYCNGDPGSARSGWIGYQNDAATQLEINNERPLGDILLTPNGNVGIGTRTPAAKLDVRGELRFGTSGELFALGSRDEPLRVVRGSVNATQTVQAGSGWVLAHATGSDTYTITFATAFADTPVVVATPVGDIDTVVSIVSVSSATCAIRTTDVESQGGGAEPAGPDEVSFSFIAVGRR